MLQSNSIAINSGTYNYYVMGELAGEFTCYAYLTPTSTIQNKLLVRYESPSKNFFLKAFSHQGFLH